MTNSARTSVRIAIMVTVLIASALMDSAWASNATLFTRQNYDLLMRWVNFLILVAVFIKFGRKPLLQFLDNQKKNVGRSIEDLEEKKKAAEALVLKSQDELKDSRERLARIKERIIAEGQTCKEKLIADAQNDARNMMDSAKRKIEGRMQTAYADIKAELVDMAADLALSQLPNVITADDQVKLAQRWFESSKSQG